ncbi:hypothetical protein F5Y04DRAFT_257054 [Hypomontagnella monticulosa]|nr:hypothetical protein F5Y04DRAFT_257054 [Hypomontagnella monticulosa]
MDSHYQGEQWALAALPLRDARSMADLRAAELQQGESDDVSSDATVHERCMELERPSFTIQPTVRCNDTDKTANLLETDENPLLCRPDVAETWRAEEYDSGRPGSATSAGRPFRMWNPIWLQTRNLAGFAGIFALSLLATILLYHFSEVHRGLGVESASREYGWRYGPTAFLTVLLSLWNQVDFATRTLTPWKGLRDGPSSADRTVLLDYVSPLMVTVLWRSIKAGHWAVLTSSSGILLIQLATIFSGGLFTLEPTVMKRDGAPLTVKSMFDGGDFTLNRTQSNIGAFPALMYYGSRIQGLAPPAGLDVGLGFVAPDFALQADTKTPDGTNYTTTVPGAQVQFDCDSIQGLNGTKTSLPWFSVLASFWIVNITTPTCNLTNVIVAEGPDHNFRHQENATRAYEGYFGDFICDSSIDYSSPRTPYPYSSKIPHLPNPSNATADHRIVMSTAELRFPPQSSEGRSSPMYLSNLTVAVCKPWYTLGNHDITYRNGLDGATKSMTQNRISNTTSIIPGFAPANLGAAVQYSLDETYLGTGGQDWVLSKQVVTFFQILSAMNGNVSVGAFMDPQRLIDSGTEAFKGIASQLIHEYMMKPANSSVAGTLSYQENRLWVTKLSVSFVCTCLSLLIGLSVLQILVRPWDVAPTNPNSIRATATVLAASPAFRSIIHGLGVAKSRAIRQRISGLNFRSRVTARSGPSFVIEPVDCPPRVEGDGGRIGIRKNTWWAPIPVRWWFQILMILTSLGVIIVLEVLQHSSDENQGFIDIDSNGFAYTHGFATYIPTLVAFFIGSMFASMQMAACTLAPWLALQRGSAPASRSLLLNLAGRLPPHRIFLALQSHNFGVTLVLLATFVAAWLPIMFSGLYAVAPVSQPQQVAMEQTDVFDMYRNNLFYSDGIAGTVAGLITYNNLSYPKWTYEDLALNTIQMTSAASNIPIGMQAPLSTHIGAIRASLNCTTIPQAVMSANQSKINYGPNGTVTMQLNTKLPWTCDSKRRNTTSMTWSQTFAMPDDGTPAYFGQGSALSWREGYILGNGAVDTDFNHPEATIYDDEYASNWVGGYGCPSFSVTLGRGRALKKENGTKVKTPSFDFDTDIATILCFQHLETVQTSVVMSYPSFEISTDNPPLVNESTAQYLITQLAHSSGRTFEFALNTLLLTLTSATANVTVPTPDEDASPGVNSLDAFVTVLATANTSTPIASLAGEVNAANLTAATEKLYKIYMAQAISANFRSTDLNAPVSTPDAPASQAERVPIAGSISIPGRLRLKQQPGPKVALQIMLGFMIVCALAGRLMLSGVDQVVPHNPCTIAGTATLLAEGDVCSRKIIPQGAEWKSNAELRSMNIFEGWMFSLGWWESMGVYKYGIDIGWIQKD